MNEITTWLINWFEENTSESRTEIEANTEANYFDSGWLDSIKFIQFLGDIEDEYEVEFDNDQFQDREFASIKGLAKIIHNSAEGEATSSEGEFTQNDIIHALRELGVQNGDHIFVHSNIGFFGKLAGANDEHELYLAFKNAMHEVVGEAGTVIHPTFSYSFCKGQDFDPQITPGICGMLSEMARQDADYTRSLDPNFSIAASGKLAEFFTEKPDNYSFGKNSFFARFMEKGGIFVNLNFDAASTFVHYAEREANVSYRWDKPFEGNIITNGKAEKATFYHYVRDLEKPEHAPVFTKFDAKAKELNLAKTVNLGRGQIVSISAKDTFDLIEKTLKTEPKFLIP